PLQLGHSAFACSFFSFLSLLLRPPPSPPLFPYTTLFRSASGIPLGTSGRDRTPRPGKSLLRLRRAGTGADKNSTAPSRKSSQAKDRKSTRLNSSHVEISYAVFCLKKKENKTYMHHIVRRP